MQSRVLFEERVEVIEVLITRFELLRATLSPGDAQQLSDTSSEKRRRIGRAGTPTATMYGSMSRLTTAPAPITAPLPTLSPGSRIAPYPIHTSWPTATRFGAPPIEEI